MRGFLIGTAATAITFAIVAYVLPQIDYGDDLVEPDRPGRSSPAW